MNGSPNDPEITVLLSLGSNLGRREEAVLEAVSRLARREDLRIASLSSLYETEPVGIAFHQPFINAACAVATRLTPREMFSICGRIERDFGRTRGDSSRDRTIDIDILAYGDAIIREADLVIPHPRLRERLFVLIPLAEICPACILPPDGTTVRDARLALVGSGSAARISSRGEIR